MNFNGVVLKNESQWARNATSPGLEIASYITNMESAKLIKLMYRGERVGDWTVEETKRYELGIVHYFQKYKRKSAGAKDSLVTFYKERQRNRYYSRKVIDSVLRIFSVYKPKHIRVMIVSFEYVDAEITRAGLSMLPYLIVGFVIMSFCSTISTLLSAAYMQQMNLHKVSNSNGQLVLACILKQFSDDLLSFLR
ncbi:unnamed protein product [Gongylonema pulchrum]|uniref:ABC transmembrane type-1 domain-containing protein n=1 Tax=Gongylonema pulchrum TaxID=637853 RepID=A0A183EXZ0_9BILA|nr:unnamed protein product [Gongylonema pulchrum]